MSPRHNAAAPVETELKLEYDRSEGVRLAALLGSLATSRTTNRLISTYFDTKEHDLARAGYSLRVRRQGRRHIQTVKTMASAETGMFERFEWEQLLRSDRPVLSTRSGPLLEVLAPDVLGRIEPLFISDVQRTLFRIEDECVAIEASMDDGELRANAQVEPICELELEIRRGPPQAVFGLARTLNEQVSLSLGMRSKSERGYALANSASRGPSKAERIALDPECSAGESLLIIVQACIRQFRANEAMLMDSCNPEALHQARVGLRRLRSAFSIFGPLLTDDPDAGHLKAELRWLMSVLGGIRNIDVLVTRVDADARDVLIAARTQAMVPLRTALASARGRSLFIDLAEWQTFGAWRTAPTHPSRLHGSVQSFADGSLEACRARVKHLGKRLVRLERERLHRTRIAAKKLRYAAEFFNSLYSSGKSRRRYRKFIVALEALQNVLGELNDLTVGAEMLERLGIKTKLSKGGGSRRKRLLCQASLRYHTLMRAKRFW